MEDDDQSSNQPVDDCPGRAEIMNVWEYPHILLKKIQGFLLYTSSLGHDHHMIITISSPQRTSRMNHPNISGWVVLEKTIRPTFRYRHFIPNLGMEKKSLWKRQPSSGQSLSEFSWCLLWQKQKNRTCGWGWSIHVDTFVPELRGGWPFSFQHYDTTTFWCQTLPPWGFNPPFRNASHKVACCIAHIPIISNSARSCMPPLQFAGNLLPHTLARLSLAWTFTVLSWYGTC